MSKGVDMLVPVGMGPDTVYVDPNDVIRIYPGEGDPTTSCRVLMKTGGFAHLINVSSMVAFRQLSEGKALLDSNQSADRVQAEMPDKEGVGR